MPAKYRRTFCLIILIVVIAAGALALVLARATGRSDRAAATLVASPRSNWSATVQGPSSRRNRAHRNLSLQPAAFEMARRLGQRFSPVKRERSILIGTLTIGSEQRIVQTIRSQTDDGEQVQITIAGTPGSLSWDAAQGARSGADKIAGSDRELVERLVLDSPDQFVVAQLRGASYSTVARNVRPTEAGDNYAGPLWNIVRVGEPRDEAKRSHSAWRLYYINTRTGLIDRIVSELRGETIEADVSGWMRVNGENVPSQIIWTNQGQTLMQYRLTTFSRESNQ